MLRSSSQRRHRHASGRGQCSVRTSVKGLVTYAIIIVFFVLVACHTMDAFFKPPPPLRLGPDPAVSWAEWKELFDIYLDASDLSSAADKRKIAVLLHCMGPASVKIHKQFHYETSEDKTKYDVVVKKFESHYKPQKNTAVNRLKFKRRMQLEGESVTDFITDVNNLVKTCEYGDQEDTMAADQIMLGVRDSTLQEKLVNTESLTVTKAIKIVTTCQSVTMIRDPNMAQVHEIHSRGRARG